ncbi:MAG: hypothetical protein ABI649_08765 [Gaiellaceae bacterium]
MNLTYAPALPSLRRPAVPAPPFNRFLLNVDFEAPAGEQWSAIGGGDSVPEAIAAAREALPDGPGWDVVRWNHLYGD